MGITLNQLDLQLSLQLDLQLNPQLDLRLNLRLNPPQESAIPSHDRPLQSPSRPVAI